MISVMHGDCRAVLKQFPENCVDSCVTDPPYALVSVVKRFGSPTAAPAKGNEAYMRASAGFMGQKWDTGETAFSAEFWRQVYRVLKPGAFLAAFGAERVILSERPAFGIGGKGVLGGHAVGATAKIDAGPATAAAAEWEGWGTALKPAFEPIVLARKPLSEGTVAANVLRWRTGALNIGACRVPFADEADEVESKTKNQHADFDSGPMTNAVYGKFAKDRENYNPPGRWPANVATDGAIELPGGAQRFFYSAKASKADRAGSKHPTVKPVALMQWLCRLVTPPGGAILDPFAGSGSTGAAAKLEGFNAVLIEREANYVTDINRRMEAAE